MISPSTPIYLQTNGIYKICDAQGEETELVYVFFW